MTIDLGSVSSKRKGLYPGERQFSSSLNFSPPQMPTREGVSRSFLPGAHACNQWTLRYGPLSPPLIFLYVWGAFLERPTEPAKLTRDRRDFFISTGTSTW